MLAVQMKGIDKRFGDVHASDHVDFELKKGEIHALLGENGAGKTTLMRILYGLYHLDEGEIYINDILANIRSPKAAIALGIGMVTQHFTLVPTLTVAENLTLGSEKGVHISPALIEQSVAEASERFGVEVDPGALVGNLSVGERQRVEILKALYRNARVLILDEPTAVLVPQEVDILFESLRRLQEKEGLSVIFISHKLYEVMEICDRITVLRDGKLVGSVDKADITQKGLARMMVGRETFGVTREAEVEKGDPMLSIRDLEVQDNQGLPALKKISLEVSSGEVLGIAGVSGNGQSELGQVLSGVLKPDRGSIKVRDLEISGSGPSEITDAGVGRIPEDRHEGVVGELSVAENIALENLGNFVSKGMLDRQSIRKEAEKLILEYQIKASPGDRIRTLSGGNMQKVILARALSREPDVVIAAQPTRGLDVGATEYVRSRLLQEAKRGAAVMLISEDLDEVRELSDRIAVIYEGDIKGIVKTKEASVELLGLMMCGASQEEAEQMVAAP
jgi:general nucleoside transport system ATP-binding protein